MAFAKLNVLGGVELGSQRLVRAPRVDGKDLAAVLRVQVAGHARGQQLFDQVTRQHRFTGPDRAAMAILNEAFVLKGRC